MRQYTKLGICVRDIINFNSDAQSQEPCEDQGTAVVHNRLIM